MRRAHELKRLLSRMDGLRIETEEMAGDQAVITITTDPGHYHGIEELVQAETHGAGSLEVIKINRVDEE